MALDTTISGASADSYISLADANTYMGERLHTDAWKASSSQKEKALKQAARILDRYIAWLGYKTDQDQALQWPRWGICYEGAEYYECPDKPKTWIYALDSETIPQEVKDAQCELALVLLSQDTQAVADTAGFSSIGVEGAVDLQVDKRDRVQEIPSHVFKIVAHLGSRKGSSVRLVRA